MYPVITISREFGSGGHSIGKEVARILEIPFLDNKIVEKVAEESGFGKDYIEEKGEQTSLLDRWFHTNGALENLVTPQDRVAVIQRKIILDQAKRGPCVIVGRCADYILDQAGISSLNVLIHADMEHRQKRVLERYGEMKGVSVEKRILRKDKGRKNYYRFFTEREWGVYSNYHLSLDSGCLGEQTCVDIIVSVAKCQAHGTSIEKELGLETRRKIHTDEAPAAVGPYSQAVERDGLVYLSGQIALDPATGELAGSTVAEQTEQICKNIRAVLEAASSSLEAVVKTTCYLTDIDTFAEFNQVYGSYFTECPARSCVAVTALPKGALCEIEVIAEVVR